MLTLKHVAKTRAFLSSLLNNTLLPSSFSFYSVSPAPAFLPQFHQPVSGLININSQDVASSFKEWFGRRDCLADQIYDILRSDEGDLMSRRSADLKLSQLGVRLSEELVLRVLKQGKDVLSCLKFFDWAGRQPGFYHTRATFHAIFKILSKAKLMSLMFDFLENYKKARYVHGMRFPDTLIMGYAVAGKPEIALHLFGRMRFIGVDLDPFAYHVLMNALLEHDCFDALNVILQQIKMRGFENDVTDSIVVKSLCKQKDLKGAERYVRDLMDSGNELTGHVVATLLDSLCKNKSFDRANKLVEDSLESGVVKMDCAHHVWIKNLCEAGKLDLALKLFQSRKSLEGSVPDIFRYNTLLCRLLREHRLQEACDLLLEMKEYQISPDKVTMNVALCFFCKAGMVDIAFQLYNSGTEFGLSPNSMTYNFLINTLCGNGSIEEAYCVLKYSIDQGCFPGKKTFTIMADALCRKGKLDKMKELLLFGFKCNIVLSEHTYHKFISTLCRSKRVEDGYLIFGELKELKLVPEKVTYCSLIHGFAKASEGDYAERLLIELQERGHHGTRDLFRAVIRCQCGMRDAEARFFGLLQRQLSKELSKEPSKNKYKILNIYNIFIDGAGHAGKPEFANTVYQMMKVNNIEPSLGSDILMLNSFLKNDRIEKALRFFDDLRKRGRHLKRLYNRMVIGLCKANRADRALHIYNEMRENDIIRTNECYEELIRLLCSVKKYEMAVKVLKDMENSGRHITSFIGNTFLVHALKSDDVYKAWVQLRERNDMTSSKKLDKLIGVFSRHIEMTGNVEDLEEQIGQCFSLDIFSYNMLLRVLCLDGLDLACMLFNRMLKKGYEPNKWTYDIIVEGLYKHGRKDEARFWVKQMFHKGFHPTKKNIVRTTGDGVM